MRRLVARIALVSAALWTLGCPGAPPRFEEISLDQARELLSTPEVSLVDAVSDQTGQPGPLPGGVRWKLGADPPERPEALANQGAVLVVGSAPRIAYRSAAALARAGNRPVYVFIPMNAEERSTLYSFALEIEEVPSGEDS